MSSPQQQEQPRITSSNSPSNYFKPLKRGDFLKKGKLKGQSLKNLVSFSTDKIYVNVNRL
jgi:hypothetical protein